MTEYDSDESPVAAAAGDFVGGVLRQPFRCVRSSPMIWQWIQHLWSRAEPKNGPVERPRRTSSGTPLRWGAVSITGNFRKNNEDNYHVDDDSRFFLVADGMGGQSAGERASELAIELISQKLTQAVDFNRSSKSEIVAAVDAAVGHANMEIMALGELESTCRNMGTTIAYIVAAAGRLYAGGVGDSRVYLLRDTDLQQLTRDHSLTQALLDAGTITVEEAATHRYKNVLYRYLGSKDGGTGTDPREIAPLPGDRYMICSDGVTDGATTDTVAEILHKENDPQKAAEAIVKAAEEGGSKDNITCIVVYVG